MSLDPSITFSSDADDHAHDALARWARRMCLDLESTPERIDFAGGGMIMPLDTDHERASTACG